MERAMLWFKCAALHDPVRPVLKQPAVIGWEAKERDVDLVIQRGFKGAELLLRMQGWVTVDVSQAIDLIRQYGRLKVIDQCDLVVETKNKQELQTLSGKLSQAFGPEAWLEPIIKKGLLG
jgi:hypothetical protein